MYILTAVGFPLSKIVHKYKINNDLDGEKQYTKQNIPTEDTN
jgi:hypothetical protein